MAMAALVFVNDEVLQKSIRLIPMHRVQAKGYEYCSTDLAVYLKHEEKIVRIGADVSDLSGLNINLDIRRNGVHQLFVKIRYRWNVHCLGLANLDHMTNKCLR